MVHRKNHSDSYVGRLFRQLGLSYQKPLYRAYRQDREAVTQWKEKVFSEIKKKAKRVGATNYFQDESGILSVVIPAKLGQLKDKRCILLGIGVGLQINLRIMGVLFLCCILIFLINDIFKKIKNTDQQ